MERVVRSIFNDFLYTSGINNAEVIIRTFPTFLRRDSLITLPAIDRPPLQHHNLHL